MTHPTPQPVSTDEVDARPGVISCSFSILGRHVDVRSTSSQFAADARRFLRSFESPRLDSKPEMVLSFDIAQPGAPGLLHAMHRDDRVVWTTESYWQLFRLLAWQLGAFLAEHVSQRYLIHGGAVARHGHGYLLPGASESGKSTLTMALVLRGFDYYSDELVVLDPVTDLLEPFAKPISCKDPSLFPALGGTRGNWFGPDRNEDGGVWYWHPADLRPEAIGHPVPARYIVFPHYDSAAEPGLEPLAPNETMRRLLENSVNFGRFDHSGLELMARLARNTKGYSLVADHPQIAAELVSQLD